MYVISEVFSNMKKLPQVLKGLLQALQHLVCHIFYCRPALKAMASLHPPWNPYSNVLKAYTLLVNHRSLLPNHRLHGAWKNPNVLLRLLRKALHSKWFWIPMETKFKKPMGPGKVTDRPSCYCLISIQTGSFSHTYFTECQLSFKDSFHPCEYLIFLCWKFSFVSNFHIWRNMVSGYITLSLAQ